MAGSEISADSGMRTSIVSTTICRNCRPKKRRKRRWRPRRRQNTRFEQGRRSTVDAKVDKTLKITAPSDLEIEMTRVFDAPRHLVFDAMTQPEHVRRWFGCAEFALPVCEIDLRVGGAYRFTMRTPDGVDSTLQGVYREVVRPERVVFTERFSMPGFTSDEYQVTSSFVEAGGRTTLTTTILHTTRENRDGHLNSGIEKGVAPAYDRLAEVVATMA